MLTQKTLLQFSLALFVTACLIFNPSQSASAATAAESVAIFPFEVHAPEDLSYLRNGIRDMLASRLATGAGVTIASKAKVDALFDTNSAAIQPDKLQSLAEQLNANYVVTGSYTSLGSGASIDAKVYSAGLRTSQDFFATAPGQADVIMAINNLAWDIGEKIFGKAKPAQAVNGHQPAVVSQVQQPVVVYQTAHPERAYLGNTGPGSPFIKPGGITGAFGFTKSQNFKMSMQAMDVGDVDGDGVDDVVIADRQNVKVYRVKEGVFGLIGEVSIAPHYKIHYLSLADLNKNGKAEIYVSSNENTTPNSFAIEWQGAQFDYLFKDSRMYIRAMEIAGEGLVLVGQSGAMDSPFEPGIYQLENSDGRPRKTVKIQVPDAINIFDFVMMDLEADGRTEVVSISQSDYLKVMNQGGKQTWSSADYYGGTTRFVGEAEMEKSAGQVKRYYIPSRIVVTDLNNDQKMDVVVNKNLSSASRIFQNLKSYPNGEIHGLAWNGIALAELWRTSQIDGYIADYQLRKIGDDGKAILYVGVILSTGVSEMFSASESTVLMYPLDLSPKEKKE